MTARGYIVAALLVTWAWLALTEAVVEQRRLREPVGEVGR